MCCHLPLRASCEAWLWSLLRWLGAEAHRVRARFLPYLPTRARMGNNVLAAVYLLLRTHIHLRTYSTSKHSLTINCKAEHTSLEGLWCVRVSWSIPAAHGIGNVCCHREGQMVPRGASRVGLGNVCCHRPLRAALTSCWCHLEWLLRRGAQGPSKVLFGVTAVHGLPAWQCWQRVLPPLVSGVPVGHEGWHWQRVLPPPLLPCRRWKPLKMASRQAGVGTALLAAL